MEEVNQEWDGTYMSIKAPRYIGVVGSRRRNCKSKVVALVNSFPSNTVVVSGGCRGVDTWAEEAARERGLDVLIHRPNLRGAHTYYQKVARFYARNKRVAQSSEVLYAFVAPDRTGGTENTIKHMEDLGKEVILK